MIEKVYWMHSNCFLLRKLIQEAKSEHDKMFSLNNVHSEFMLDIIQTREVIFRETIMPIDHWH